MTELTKQEISTLLIDFFNETKNKIEAENIDSILKNKNPVTSELFSEDIKNYLYFLVSQRVTISFTTRLGKVMEKLIEKLIEAQGGQILESPKPYDIKFILDGFEYWIEIKSINGQNSSNKQTISERKVKAENEGKIFKLCIYNDENNYNEDYILNGEQFWNFIVGEENAKDIVFEILKENATDLSFKDIITTNYERLLNEYYEKLQLPKV